MWEAEIDLSPGRRLFRKVIRGSIGKEPVELALDLLDEASYSGKIGGNPFSLTNEPGDDGAHWVGSITGREFSFPEGDTATGDLVDRRLVLTTKGDVLDVQLGADVLTLTPDLSNGEGVGGLARYERLQRPRAGDGPPLAPLSTGQVAAIVVAIVLSRPKSPLPR